MRVWLLTCTTYATWLPGDPRGCVTAVRDRRPGDAESAARIEHDLPGTPYDGGMPGLRLSAAEAAGTPVYLTLAHAEVVAVQFRETATHRGWSLLALAVMANHFHAVARVPGDPEPRKLLAHLKAYGTRVLNERFGRREDWWTRGGSKRKLGDARAVAAGVNYVLRKQWRPLVTWPADETPGEPRASATGVLKASRERERPERAQQLTRSALNSLSRTLRSIRLAARRGFSRR